MKGRIIVFRLNKKVGQVEMNKFCRQFYGYIDRSNNGQYSYRRPGFIDSIHHVKVIRGVVVVGPADAPKVVEFLEKFGAEVYVWSVTSILEPLK